MVCLEDGSPSPAVQTLAIIENDDEDSSERAPSFVIESSDIKLPLVKLGDRRVAT